MRGLLAQLDAAPGPGDAFGMFSPMHGAVVVICGGIIGLACVLGRRWRGTERERWLRSGVAGLSLGIYAVYVGEGFLPERFSWGYSLPLHVCDLMGMLATAVMVVPRRWSRGLLYYFGLGLCTQGFITPIVTSGPAHLHFWLFFWLHTWIVGAAVYDLVVGGFRPTWADYRRSMGIGLAYVALLMGFNVGMGTNYGYIGPSNPAVPTLVDHLGAWPGRVGLMVLMGGVVFALLTLPWAGVGTRRAAPGSGSPVGT